MQNWIKSAAIAAVAVMLTSVFFIDFCNFVYQCGCTHLWAGADMHCNIHHTGTNHCPWCSTGVAGSYSIYAAIALPQVLLAFRPKRWTARRRLAARTRLSRYRLGDGGYPWSRHGILELRWRQIIVLGGGLAGLAAAAALGGAATKSPPRSPAVPRRARHVLSRYRANDAIRDHRQLPAHPAALLRQPSRLLRAFGVRDRVEFHREFYFIEPGGRTSIMKGGPAAQAPAFHRIVR